MQSFKKTLTCSFKYDMRNCEDFHATTLKSKKFHFDGLFLSKVFEFWAKKYRWVIFHDTEQRCRIWRNADLGVSKMTWQIVWTFFRAKKILKNYTRGLKNDIRNLVNFHANSRKSGNLIFDGRLLSPFDLDEKLQKSYLSWDWRVMHSLKKNWLFVWKVTWGI